MKKILFTAALLFLTLLASAQQKYFEVPFCKGCQFKNATYFFYQSKTGPRLSETSPVDETIYVEHILVDSLMFSIERDTIFIWPEKMRKGTDTISLTDLQKQSHNTIHHTYECRNNN